MVVYIVLGVLYESYIHPITILSTLPSACMGALILLWLTGKGMDIIEKHDGIIGFVSEENGETIFYFELPVYKSVENEK